MSFRIKLFKCCQMEADCGGSRSQQSVLDAQRPMLAAIQGNSQNYAAATASAELTATSKA